MYLKHRYVHTGSCLLLFMLIHNYNHIPEFVSTPTSINATLGSTATFSCSATTGIIGWQVNGSVLSELSAPNITTNQVGNTRFLHIPATEFYNNTVVRCAIAILDGDDLYSDTVILKVQGTYYKEDIHVCYMIIRHWYDRIIFDVMRQLNPIIPVSKI